MLIFRIISLFIFLTLVANSKIDAQNREYIDSLSNELETSDDTTRVKICLKLLQAYAYYSQDTVCLYARRMHSIAVKDKSSRVFPLSLDALGYCHSGASNFDSSLYYYQKALDVYTSRNDKALIAKALNNISSPLYSQGKLQEALDYALQSLRISEELGLRGEVIAANYWNIGNMAYELDDLNESNDYYNKSAEIYLSLGKKSHFMDLQNLKALNYKDMDSLDLAIGLFEKCKVYYQDKNQLTELASTLENMGQVYMAQEEYGKAERSLLDALPLAEQSGEKRMAGFIYQRLCDFYIKNGKLQLAEQYGLKSLANSEELGILNKIPTDNRNLANIYQKKKQFEQAFTHFQTFHVLNDSINGVEKRNALEELKIEYETEKKEQEIVLLEEKAKRSELEKKGMITGIFALLGFFGVLIYAMRQRMVKNRIAKAKVDQELEFSNKELDLKKQELTAYALQLAHKNEVLEDIKANVSNAQRSRDNNQSLQKVINKIDFNQNDDESWEGFRTRFQAVHIDFEAKVKQNYPGVSSNEMRLMALLKMNLSSKEIANILNISHEGIKKARYRLRKKLGLETGASLEELVLNI
ncbi:MAG: tetratricopeptide repeat protein [Bacteroidota bacterium]